MSLHIDRRAVLAGAGALLALGAGGYALVGGAPSAEAAGVIYKAPTCGCCGAWAEQMAAAGLRLAVEHPGDLGAVKDRHAVPYGMSSCHTAVVDGYVVEGHVPIDLVRQLLAERPAVRGLAVPGMPAGAPGMESAGAEAYTVYVLGRDGTATPLTRVAP